MSYPIKGPFEFNEDMVQILLMLEIFFTQGSEAEDLFCGASSVSEARMFFSDNLFSRSCTVSSQISKKSFYRVWHAAFWATMRNANIISAIGHLCDKVLEAVYMNGSTEERFRTTVGVKQELAHPPSSYSKGVCLMF